MSASSQYLDVLTRLETSRAANQAEAIRAAAQARAGAQAANAEIWGKTLGSLGQYVAQLPQQRAELKRIENQAAETQLRREQMEREATRQKRQDEEDQQFRDAYSRAAEEFQQGGLVSQADGIRIGDAIEREKDAGTYRGPDDSGQMLPVPQGSGKVRQSPFPTPDELLKINPQRAVPMINAIAALKGIDPKASPETKVKQLQTFYLGFQKMPHDMKVSSYPALLDLFEKNQYIPVGVLPREWNDETEAFIMGTGQEQPRAAANPTEASLAADLSSPDPAVRERAKVALDRIRPIKPEGDSGAKTGTFEDYVVRKYGPNPTPEQVLEARKAYGQADDRPAVTLRMPNGMTPGQAFEATRQLRNDYNRETTAARTVQQQLALMKSSLDAVRKGSLPAGSQGVLVTFQKILDPTSVVRESEYARSASGLSLLGRLEGSWTKISQGGAGVTPADLEQFVSLAEQFAKNQKMFADQSREQINAIAKDYGLKPESITRDVNPTPAATEKVVTQAQLQAIAKKNGTTVEQEAKRAAAAGYIVR